MLSTSSTSRLGFDFFRLSISGNIVAVVVVNEVVNCALFPVAVARGERCRFLFLACLEVAVIIIFVIFVLVFIFPVGAGLSVRGGWLFNVCR